MRLFEKTGSFLSGILRLFASSRTPTPALLVFLIVICVIFGSFNRLFFSWGNINSVINNLTFDGVLCLGMTVIILAGEIDLSIGSNIALCSVLVTKMFDLQFSVASVVVVVLALGIVIGIINGLLVNTVGINSIIATIGTMTTLKGLAFLFTQTRPMTVNAAYSFIGRGYLLDAVPITAVYFLVLLATFAYVLRYSVLGRDIYFVGANREAARLAGINVRRTKFVAFLLSALIASLAAVMLTSQLSNGRPEMGEGSELEVITIVVLGGVSILGGIGNYAGVVVALLILTVIQNGMVLMNLPIFWRYVARGVILIAALLIDALKTRQREVMLKMRSIRA